MTTFQREFEEEMRDDLHHLLGGLRFDSGIPSTDDSNTSRHPLMNYSDNPMGYVVKVSEFDLQNAFDNWFNTAPKAKPEDYSIFK